MKITKVIHYQAKPEAADANAELSADVFRELHATAPKNVAYAVLRADDAFYHIVTYETEADNEQLTGLPAFARFAENGAARRLTPPTVTDVTVIGNYHILPT
jgi:hypothetical protein